MEQDWETVVLKPRGKKKSSKAERKEELDSARRDGGALGIERKYGASENKAAHSTVSKSLRKLDDNDDDYKHDTVDRAVGLAIQQGRAAKGWTQKQLAGAISERVTVISDYENGRAIPNQQILRNIESALNITIARRSHK